MASLKLPSPPAAHHRTASPPPSRCSAIQWRRPTPSLLRGVCPHPPSSSPTRPRPSAPPPDPGGSLQPRRTARAQAGEGGTGGVGEGAEEGSGKEAGPSELYEFWDKATSSLTACSTVANLLMMMPQILKNAASLAAGSPSELAGLSWIAFTTGFLGNMLLLSYFTEQRQLSACIVQVLWSSFSPVPTPLPGVVAALVGLVSVFRIRTGAASKPFVDTWQKLSGWTATLLFMFMPVAQLQACVANPANLAGLSPTSNLIGLIGNGLMVPRALFTRDLIWFTGSTWGAMMMGWGMLLALALFSYIPMPAFSFLTVVWFAYLGAVLSVNAKAHNLQSPLSSILYLRP